MTKSEIKKKNKYYFWFLRTFPQISKDHKQKLSMSSQEHLRTKVTPDLQLN